MLIERGAEVATRLAERWTTVEGRATGDARSAEDALWLREILGELLAGVTADGGALAKQVADLYVFLLQHLTAAEETREVAAIAEIRSVLEIERDTWTQVVARMSNSSSVPAPAMQSIASGGLSVHA
jgi:flagellar secretion chaperone FliS